MSNISNLNGTLVIGALKVPVRNITDAILDRNPVDVIQKRFPISVEEIFECLDAVADHDTIGIHDRLVVVNQSVDNQEITLTTTDRASITNNPPVIANTISCLVMIPIAPNEPPNESEPVSPMKIFAGGALNHKKPKHAPIIEPQKMEI